MKQDSQFIVVDRDIGTANDALDNLKVDEAIEDPSVCDRIKMRAFKDSESDPDLASVLKTFHIQEDRVAAFEDFKNSTVPKAASELMGKFGITTDSTICDLGCGTGLMTYSLLQMGYKNISAMDPNDQWYSGTGYLKSIVGDQIKIYNDLEEWHGVRHKFDGIVSNSTIHHWPHIPRIALETRRTMKPGAYWFALVEWYANSPDAFVQGMSTHPIRTRYNSYEWAYPAAAYVDLIESVGFQLVAVVPWFCWNNALVTSQPAVPAGVDAEKITQFVEKELTSPGGTVETFWAEIDNRRRGLSNSPFLTPQAFVFQRVSCEKQKHRAALHRKPDETVPIAEPAAVGPAHRFRNKAHQYANRLGRFVGLRS